MLEYERIEPILEPLMLTLAGGVLVISIALLIYFAVGGEKPME